jgi:hypothetical protein
MGRGAVEPEPGPPPGQRAGLRDKEREWCRTHLSELRGFIGEWVILEGERVVGHGTDSAGLIAKAKRQGIKIPYIFLVREVDSGLATLGL